MDSGDVKYTWDRFLAKSVSRGDLAKSINKEAPIEDVLTPDAGTVVFSDLSEDLLDHCRRFAEGRGVASRCRFVQASADDLSPFADASVDVVTTRSVLIYVADKRRADAAA